MGRPKSYERKDVITKAMELFWRQGYGATSITDLEEHISINRYSLFAEFGSKQGLFEEAIKLYRDEVVTSYLSIIHQKGSGITELRALIEFFRASAQSPNAHLGCLICNTATELAGQDDSSQEVVKAHTHRLTRALITVLENAQSANELTANVDITKEGHLFASSIMGLFVISRARVPFDIVEGFLNALDYHIDRIAVKGA